MNKKPEVDKILERARSVYTFMAKQNVVTKEQICEHLGWVFNTSNERRVRDIISYIAKKVPVIATSDSKGYKIADVNDSEGINHQLKELQSRVDEIQKRIDVLHVFSVKNNINSITK